MVCIWLCQTCPIVSIDLGELQIDEYLGAVTHLSRNKKLLESQVIVTALPLKKFSKHKKFFTGKEEWSRPWLLFVDGDTETVVYRKKSYGNPDVEYKYFTEGIKAWLDLKAKQ